MSMSNLSRQPKGIPTGGQFAASAHAESDVSLDQVPEHFPDGPPLSAEESGTAAKVDTLLRLLDDPEQHLILPDGSKVEIVPDSAACDENGKPLTGLVEEGLYFIHRPDDSTAVRGFSDIGDRGKVAQEIAFESVRDARHYGTSRHFTGEIARTVPVRCKNCDEQIEPDEDDGHVHADSGLAGCGSPFSDQEKYAEPADDTDGLPEGAVRNGNGTATGPDGKTYRDDPGSFWHGTEIIHTYTRSQALADGTLRDRLDDDTDLNQMAAEAGIPVPVAFTSAAFADGIAWNDKNAGLQDESGRAWDALWMAARPIRAHAMRNGGNLTVGERIPFGFLRVPNTPRAQVPKMTRMNAVFTTDEHGKPCFTICMPGED